MWAARCVAGQSIRWYEGPLARALFVVQVSGFDVCPGFELNPSDSLALARQGFLKGGYCALGIGNDGAIFFSFFISSVRVEPWGSPGCARFTYQEARISWE